MAPTPSGYLHLGNAWSFLLAWLLARKAGGRLWLRIDDLDAARFREEYLEDIFASLAWLGLDWDLGPKDPGEFHRSYRQTLRLGRYGLALGELRRAGRVYACDCSRARLQAAGAAAYPGWCRDRGLDPGAPDSAWRFRLGAGTVDVPDAWRGPLPVDLAGAMGDFVVRKKDGLPAYQLASLVDDAEWGVDQVVRGADLLPSTAAQLELARALGHGGFARARFHHHGLLVDGRGRKLSKSAGAPSLRSLRNRGVTAGRVLALFARHLGMAPAAEPGLGDILAAFDPGRDRSGPCDWDAWAGALGAAPA